MVTQIKSDGLKPCPFCGGPAHMRQSGWSQNFRVECVRKCVRQMRWYWWQEEAAKFWNIRQPSA